MDRRTRRELLAQLSSDASRIATHFELRYRSIDAERASVKSRYGICYDDGSIRIRLNHSRTGEPLRYSSLVNTLCHELAHLRHFDHGPRFKTFYLRLLEWSRQQGIYVPGASGSPREPVRTLRASTPTRETRTPTGPQQLDLFG